MIGINTKLANKLNQRIADGSLRTLKNHDGLVDFCSNDYLGLASSTVLEKAIAKEVTNYGPVHGATGSRLLSGNTLLAEEVEQYLSRLFMSEGALLFNSGYSANLALLSSIPQKGDTIVYDQLAHACIKDGARLSPAKRYSFLHNDLKDLEGKLKKAEGNIFIIVESVYSMDGDICPLHDLVILAQRYSAALIIDEAHSTGVYGPQGAGMVIAEGLAEHFFARIHTFGKGMGVHGAAIVGSTTLLQYMVNFARPFIYTTAMPSHGLIALRAAFDHLGDNQQLQQELTEKISLFQNYFEEYSPPQNGYLRVPSDSPIQAILIPGNERVKVVSRQLMEQGYDVRPILSPTVKKGEERLRVCLHTYNSDSEIKGLIATLLSLQ